MRLAGEWEINDKVSSVMGLVDLLDDQDHFLRLYEKLAGLRLINETSYSREVEEHVIEKLVTKYGREQLTRLKQMFVDIDLSEGLLSKMLTESRQTSLMFQIQEEQKRTSFSAVEREVMPVVS